MTRKPGVISKKQFLGQILLKKGIISAEQLKSALEMQKNEGGILGEILMKLGYIGEKDLVTALIVQCNIPYLSVDKYEPDPKLKEILREEFMQEHYLVPIEKVEDVLSVVMANPLDTKTIQETEALTKCKVVTFIATKKEIANAINKLYNKGQYSEEKDAHL